MTLFEVETSNMKLLPAVLLTITMTTTISSTVLAGDDAAPTKATPPVAKKIHKETKIHGDVLPDDYFWLREKSNPEVAAYLAAENAYTDSIMAPTKPLQEALYKELLSHVKETDISVPYPDGYQLLPKERIGHCHCKDVVHKPDKKYDWAPVGGGSVDWVGQLRALNRDGFRFGLSLETHWHGAGTPEASTRASFDGLKKALSKAGIPC